jgi:hypothetical protein
MSRNTLQERLNYYNELIPPIYPQDFPTHFELRPADWVLTPEIVNRAPLSVRHHGEEKIIRQIGTMDIEILSNATVHLARAGRVNLITHYPCGLKCPGCFSEENIFGDARNLMTWQEVMSVIDVARKLGLSSIKFLGPGELFQNPDLFDILDACEMRNLPLSIFTKGAELGDDTLAKKNFSHLNITTAKELVTSVARYKTVRILLGFNSFFPERQDALVGSTNATGSYAVVDGAFEHRGISNYTQKRDRALQLLINAGFSDSSNGQRLSLIMAPLQKNQLDEVAELYEWAARRNLPVVIAPSMESGPKAQKLVSILKRSDPDNAWLLEAYLRVYRRALAMGIETIERLEEKGISPYLGIEACNQVGSGLMMRLNGQIKICPGSSRSQHIYGNVHTADGLLDPDRLIELWLNSINYRIGPLQNNWCLAKKQMLPRKMQHDVLKELRNREG